MTRFKGQVETHTRNETFCSLRRILPRVQQSREVLTTMNLCIIQSRQETPTKPSHSPHSYIGHDPPWEGRTVRCRCAGVHGDVNMKSLVQIHRPGYALHQIANGWGVPRLPFGVGKEGQRKMRGEKNKATTDRRTFSLPGSCD